MVLRAVGNSHSSLVSMIYLHSNPAVRVGGALERKELGGGLKMSMNLYATRVVVSCTLDM